MANIHITIDDQQLEVAEGITILEAARGNGIHIPTLCFLKELDPRASCRICVVEVEGMRTFQPSCSTKVRDGMVVRTNTEAVRANRKLTLELIMAHHPVDCHHCLRIGSSKEQGLDPKFCEMCFFCDCVRDGICELQALNREYHVDNLPFALEGCRYEEDVSLHSIIRNSNKCVKCRRCVDVCNDVQNVHNLAMFSRGQDYRVTASMGKPMQESLCVRCGRCVDVCPTGALYMEESIDHMLSDAHTYGITTVGMVSASVLPELERLNHMEPGTLDIHRVIAGMKKIGIDCMISEEQVVNANQELAEKLIQTSKKTAVISNSFAVKNFVEEFYPHLAHQISYYPSVQETFDSMVRGEVAGQFGWDVNTIKTVVFTDNNENGAEAQEKNTANYSMNSREIYRTFQRTGVDLRRIHSKDPLKFGMEKEYVFTDVTGPVAFNYEKEIQVLKVAGKKVAIAHNLGQCRKLLEELESGSCPYDIIRLCA